MRLTVGDPYKATYIGTHTRDTYIGTHRDTYIGTHTRDTYIGRHTYRDTYTYRDIHNIQNQKPPITFVLSPYVYKYGKITLHTFMKMPLSLRTLQGKMVSLKPNDLIRGEIVTFLHASPLSLYTCRI